MALKASWPIDVWDLRSVTQLNPDTYILRIRTRVTFPVSAQEKRLRPPPPSTVTDLLANS